MEQFKIMQMIHKWGYLKAEQIALLLNNKNYHTTKRLLDELVAKRLVKIDKLTRKNIYILSALGNRKLGRESKTIRINYNELNHQDMLIKWISKQNVMSYETERDLKSLNPREKGYADLLVHYENKSVFVEFERTKKTKDRYTLKISSYRKYIKDDYEILWLVPNEPMKKFIQDQVNNFNWKKEAHSVEIFN